MKVEPRRAGCRIDLPATTHMGKHHHERHDSKGFAGPHHDDAPASQATEQALTQEALPDVLLCVADLMDEAAKADDLAKAEIQEG